MYLVGFCMLIESYRIQRAQLMGGKRLRVRVGEVFNFIIFSCFSGMRLSFVIGSGANHLDTLTYRGKLMVSFSIPLVIVDLFYAIAWWYQ